MDARGSAPRMDRSVPFGTVVAVSCLICDRRRQQPGSMRSVPFRLAILDCLCWHAPRLGTLRRAVALNDLLNCCADMLLAFSL